MLSAVANATRRRWAHEGRAAEPTRVHPPAAAQRVHVADASGACSQPAVSWDQLLTALLQEKASTVPVHPGIEPFETRLAGDVTNRSGQLGVRAMSTGDGLPPDAFLGFYQGWVGTTSEAAATIVEHFPIAPAGARHGCCLPPASSCLLERVRAELHIASYAAALPTVAGRPYKEFVVAPIAPDGTHVGNLLCRINDGTTAAFAGVPTFGAHEGTEADHCSSGDDDCAGASDDGTLPLCAAEAGGGCDSGAGEYVGGGCKGGDDGGGASGQPSSRATHTASSTPATVPTRRPANVMLVRAHRSPARRPPAVASSRSTHE